MNNLVLTVGLPRSGKSTWSQRVGVPVVNPDSIRLVIHGQAFFASAEPLVWATARIMVSSLFLAGQTWVVDFEPHEANVGVTVVTECKSPAFYAYDSFPILDVASSRLSVRRQPVPKGARCTVLGFIMRQKDDDPAHDYIGESVTVIQKGDGDVEIVPPSPPKEEYP